MAPRPDVSEERKAQIIESAIKVFARDGFSGARMDDVAAESGVSKGLLYWYFKGKAEIISAIADMLFSGEFRRMEEFVAEDRTACECLEEFLNLFLKDLRRMSKVMPVVYEFYAMAFRNTVVRRVMQNYLKRYLAIMEPVFQRGMDRGEFAAGNAREMAITFGAALEGTMLLWSYSPKLFDPEEQLRAAMTLVLNGLERK
jgi:TetR/AcrR family fatty acid metabolism transcriptional regulator